MCSNESYSYILTADKKGWNWMLLLLNIRHVAFVFFKLLKVLTWFYWSNLKRQFFGKWFVEQNSGKILMIFITGWRTCCERVRFSKLLTFTRFRNIAMRFTIIRTFIRFCQFRMRFSKMLRFLIVIGWRWARRGAVTNLSFTDPEKLKSKQNGCSAGIWIAN